jgi:hypothetical protein
MTPETEKLLFFLEPLEDGADLPDFFRAEVLEVFEPLQGEGEKFVLRFRLRLRGGSEKKDAMVPVRVLIKPIPTASARSPQSVPLPWRLR